ncbi:hypothetical protein SARC_02522 [Sphaeroforma arctica JP610]|uniref:Uncharacterized protein n=1 Tax=Sphaeroforma arctica JP610 TaxID=667725 RepID=A0A0L0G8Q9_9EUKA|nr:hypothetical protein SARC_02522 [Sphaeroforma arctica JP610]KNC85299.1 hypothetical protein SARC_02522 [Sphaeroforma arctica JP610]|eukprot:XP_014159201.1 hypothetical protein SARC_02522 [Sphaeroforma arctica JP610]
MYTQQQVHNTRMHSQQQVHNKRMHTQQQIHNTRMHTLLDMHLQKSTLISYLETPEMVAPSSTSLPSLSDPVDTYTLNSNIDTQLNLDLDIINNDKTPSHYLSTFVPVYVTPSERQTSSVTSSVDKMTQTQGTERVKQNAFTQTTQTPIVRPEYIEAYGVRWEWKVVNADTRPEEKQSWKVIANNETFGPKDEIARDTITYFYAMFPLGNLVETCALANLLLAKCKDRKYGHPLTPGELLRCFGVYMQFFFIDFSKQPCGLLAKAAMRP